MNTNNATKIMVIRHAEKPDKPDSGVSLTGASSSHDLIVSGWQRAGALTVLFAPTYGPLQNQGLATPGFLFASDDSSQRPIETITPISQKLGLIINQTFKEGGEETLATTAAACAGVVLIAWQHGRIPEIARYLLAGSPDLGKVPNHWPSHRFDIVWVFDLDASGFYLFSQVPQMLLFGDKDSFIKDSQAAAS